ncbi:hypothetical protein MRX96_016876 [Rhipicephalus microplus]
MPQGRAPCTEVWDGAEPRAAGGRAPCHRATYRPVDENVVREGDPFGRLAPRQGAAALIRGLQHSSSWVSAAKHITQNTGNEDHLAPPAP